MSCCQGNLFARDNTPAVVHGVQCYQGESSVFRFKAGSELQCKVTLSPRSNRPRPFWKSDDVWLDLEGEARSLVVKERQVTLRENKLGPLCAYVTLINPSNAKKSVSIKAPTKIGKFYLVKSRKFDSDYLSKGSTPRKGDLREKIKKNISSSSRERKNFGKSERALTTGTPTQKKSGAVKIKEKSPPHSADAHKSFLPRRDRKNTPIGGSALYSPREIRRERKRHWTEQVIMRPQDSIRRPWKIGSKKRGGDMLQLCGVRMRGKQNKWEARKRNKFYNSPGRGER